MAGEKSSAEAGPAAKVPVTARASAASAPINSFFSRCVLFSFV
jgi:hypothetical protein